MAGGSIVYLVIVLASDRERRGISLVCRLDV